MQGTGTENVYMSYDLSCVRWSLQNRWTDVRTRVVHYGPEWDSVIFKMILSQYDTSAVKKLQWAKEFLQYVNETHLGPLWGKSLKD